MIAILSPSLPPPPPSTCLCSRLLLIFEALSFVSVRCPKDYGMKRDRWRGAGWLRLWCVTTWARARTRRRCRILQTVLTSDLSRSSLPWLPWPSATALETLVRLRRSNTKFNWNCTELEERKGKQQTNYHPHGARWMSLSAARECAIGCVWADKTHELTRTGAGAIFNQAK